MNIDEINKNREVNSAAIAHELRNPLNNISLSCEQLIEGLESNETKEKLLIYLEIIKRNSRRIDNLINELFSEKEEDGRKSLLQIIEESLSLATDRLSLKQVRLEKVFHSGESVFFTNPGQLKLAFLNIIINAVESMENGKGILKIHTTERGSELIIRFTDNGAGIHQAEISRLFDPHYTSKKGGMGMGLAITKEILRKTNGEILVDSRPGEGSTFSIIFSQ